MTGEWPALPEAVGLSFPLGEEAGRDVSETYPWAWYSDPAVLERERERIFRRAWHYVGHAGSLAEPSSTSPARPAGCRWSSPATARVSCARSSTSASTAAPRSPRAPARRETLQCPYHAWTYGLDGPAALGAAGGGARPRGLSLVPLRLEGGGRSSSSAPSRRRRSRSVELALPFDPAALVFRERVDYALEANWKIAVENYLECYHCPVAHPGLHRASSTSIRMRTVSRRTGRAGASTATRATATASASSTSSGRR